MAELKGIIKAIDAASGAVIDVEDVPDAIPERGEYSCLLCGSQLIAKKGTKVMHHFAHHHAEECDPWASGMTAWHLAGQRLLEQRGARLEVPFANADADGHRHRVDALVTDRDGYRTGIELQHSPMGAKMFDVRNGFYLDELDELIWVFDVRGKDVGLDIRYPNPRELREFGGRPGWWSRSPEWFSDSILSHWYRRRLTVFLYVSGHDDWVDGRIVEVIVPPVGNGRHGARWVGREMLVHEWADEMVRRGSFVGRNRVHDLTWSYFDGTSETVPVRCGATLPRPRRKPRLPEGKTEIVPTRSRMPNRATVMRQQLADRMLTVRLVGVGPRGGVKVAYGSTRGQVVSAVAAELGRRGMIGLAKGIPEADIPPVLTDDITLAIRQATTGSRAGRGVSRRGKATVPPVARKNPRQDAAKVPAKRATGATRHRVDVVDEDGLPLGFTQVTDGSSLASAVASIRESLGLFASPDDYVWPSNLTGQVYGDMKVTVARRTSKTKVRIIAQGGAGGDIDISMPAPKGSTVGDALGIARSLVGEEVASPYSWDVPNAGDEVDGEVFVRLKPVG